MLTYLLSISSIVDVHTAITVTLSLSLSPRVPAAACANEQQWPTNMTRNICKCLNKWATYMHRWIRVRESMMQSERLISILLFFEANPIELFSDFICSQFVNELDVALNIISINQYIVLLSGQFKFICFSCKLECRTYKCRTTSVATVGTAKSSGVSIDCNQSRMIIIIGRNSINRTKQSYQ